MDAQEGKNLPLVRPSHPERESEQISGLKHTLQQQKMEATLNDREQAS